MFHCGTCSGWRWWPVAEVCLIFLLPLCRWSGDAAATFLPRGAFGLGEGLLVRMLLGMHLFIQEVTGHFITVVNLQLGNRQKNYEQMDWRIQFTSHEFWCLFIILNFFLLHMLAHELTILQPWKLLSQSASKSYLSCVFLTVWFEKLCILANKSGLSNI